MVSLAYSASAVGAQRTASALPAPQKVITVFDIETGECRAVISGDLLLWQYTGAMGAVAIEALSHPRTRSLGLIGAGRQARGALRAALEVRDLAQVLVYSRHLENARVFADEFADSAEVVPVGSIDEVAAETDVIVTATTSAEPLLRGHHLGRVQHINAIGAHYPDRSEIDVDVVASADVFVEDVAQAMEEKGELLRAAAEGAFSFETCHTLGSALAAGVPPRGIERLTLFASCGSGIELLGAACGVVEALSEEAPTIALRT